MEVDYGILWEPNSDRNEIDSSLYNISYVLYEDNRLKLSATK